MQVISHSVKETLKIGRAIARYAAGGDIICLFGDLGSGKTVLAKGVACGLGIDPGEIISPTFILIHEYAQARIPFYHFDLYRLNLPEEIVDLGYEEYFYNDGLTVIEWADRLKTLLPEEYLKIELSVGRDKIRVLKFSAQGGRYQALLRKIDESRLSS